jgi:hypothetical protein
MGEGLKRGTSDYDRVKRQIISGQWDISGKLPHRAILDFNIITAGNWLESKYKYAPFSTSFRSLVKNHQRLGIFRNQNKVGHFQIYI